MTEKPLVSAIIIFFNAERFLSEAIESVLMQTYEHWELLLVDDGSTDGSRVLADHYAARSPKKIRVFSHPGNENRGKGATRNLGIQQAHGEFVAFLDADDVWLRNKLEEQVAILQSYPKAVMLYGDTLYWYSWTGERQHQAMDFVPPLRVPSGAMIDPPQLLPAYLRGKAAVPCTCSIILKRSSVLAINGFDETFTGVANIYEDQAFYAKIVLAYPVIAVARCWDRYRQHPEASTAVAASTERDVLARDYFLRWLATYMTQQGVEDAVLWQALRREQWHLRNPTWLPANKRLQAVVRWAKKWLLRVEERLLPAALSRRLWGAFS